MYVHLLESLAGDSSQRGMYVHLLESLAGDSSQRGNNYQKKHRGLGMGENNYQKKHRGLGMDGLTPIQKLNQCASVNLTLQCYKI